ncbi:SDR family NAD(P)-dependent oxidoreductase [[Erwinia] mediterraneensis]|uniref:SDR family NAD(P)-dependent oxidoreductase n=1 Tax=[Erwinia] mediterraneensis TaxID=2161819 RepID=UPI0010305862|nr:SDR family oxidoreductase [[Erwinia] mediterraneensis]
MYLEKFSVSGKLAVITGAGRGIGLAIADALGEAGARLAITDIDSARAEQAAAGLREKGYQVDSYTLDVTQPDVVNAISKEMVERYGRVDILVNNAGISICEKAENMSDSDWCRVIDVNLNGVFWCCRAFGKAMLEAGGGTVVNVGSMSGFIVNRPQEQSQYNASKAAVHHLTRSLAAEWAGRGVRVNAVAPTYIATEMTAYVNDSPEMHQYWVGGTPMQRMGRPEEVASVVLFLASEASSLMTGSIVLADGGYVCW